jgi:hypothetical protein
MKIKKLIMLTPPIRPSSTPKIMLLDYKLVNNEGRYWNTTKIWLFNSFYLLFINLG